MLSFRSVIGSLGAEPAEAEAITQRMAQGHLDTAIRVRQGDTSSRLHSIKELRDSLVHIVGDVRKDALGVATARQRHGRPSRWHHE